MAFKYLSKINDKESFLKPYRHSVLKFFGLLVQAFLNLSLWFGLLFCIGLWFQWRFCLGCVGWAATLSFRLIGLWCLFIFLNFTLQANHTLLSRLYTFDNGTSSRVACLALTFRSEVVISEFHRLSCGSLRFYRQVALSCRYTPTSRLLLYLELIFWLFRSYTSGIMPFVSFWLASSLSMYYRPFFNRLVHGSRTFELLHLSLIQQLFLLLLWLF